MRDVGQDNPAVPGGGCISAGTSTVSISELGFVDAASHQLKVFDASIHPTPARNPCVLSTFLRTLHDLPFDTDEHPYPSSYDFCDFHPEEEERTFTLRSRV